jgi:hypothetical protein
MNESFKRLFRVWLTFCWFPNRCADVSIIFQQDTPRFVSHFGNGKFLEKSDSRYGSIPTGRMLRCSVYIYDRFLRNPMAEIIDLDYNYFPT